MGRDFERPDFRERFFRFVRRRLDVDRRRQRLALGVVRFVCDMHCGRATALGFQLAFLEDDAGFFDEFLALNAWEAVLLGFELVSSTASVLDTCAAGAMFFELARAMRRISVSLVSSL